MTGHEPEVTIGQRAIGFLVSHRPVPQTRAPLKLNSTVVLSYTNTSI
jgi:hypothetical protein